MIEKDGSNSSYARLFDSGRDQEIVEDSFFLSDIYGV